MSDKIEQFRSDLRKKIEEVDQRFNAFKENVESTGAKAKADIQAHLEKTKTDFEARKREAEEVQNRIKANIEAKKEETESKIQEWKHQREVKKMEKRAQRAENYAVESIWLAMLSVEEAEYAALEAIAARLEADEVAGA